MTNFKYPDWDKVKVVHAPTPFEQVGEFHKAFGHPYFLDPSIPEARKIRLRLSLIVEEVEELFDACLSEAAGDKHGLDYKFYFRRLNEAIQAIDDRYVDFDVVEAADALGDINYVVNGAAHTFGFNLDAVTSEIHRSNMSKLGPDGKPIYRDDGKVIKGPNYFPPNIKKILQGDSQ